MSGSANPDHIWLLDIDKPEDRRAFVRSIAAITQRQIENAPYWKRIAARNAGVRLESVNAVLESIAKEGQDGPYVALADFSVRIEPKDGSPASLENTIRGMVVARKVGGAFVFDEIDLGPNREPKPPAPPEEEEEDEPSTRSSFRP